MSAIVQINDWSLDPGTARLSRAETSHALDPKDLSVLLHLLECAPDYVSSRKLLARSWSGSVVGDNALHQVIGRLRKLLGDNARAPRYIETAPKRGYRMVTLQTSVWGPPIDELRMQPANWRALVTRKPTVTVLPLRDLSPKLDLAWLADGLTEDLRHGLHDTRLLMVLPGASIQEAVQAGQIQASDFMVDGSIQGDAFGVSVRLELLSSGTQAPQTIWTQRLDSEAPKRLSQQHQLADQATQAIHQALVEDITG